MLKILNSGFAPYMVAATILAAGQQCLADTAASVTTAARTVNAAPRQIALSVPAAAPVVPVAVPVTMAQPEPSPVALYGMPGDKNSNPILSTTDNFYSGSNLRPRNFNCWYGNGYNW